MPFTMKTSTTKMLSLLSALTVLLWASAAAQNASDKIFAEALKPSPIDKQLRVLTDEIGGRVPGTPAMDKAVQWGLAAFKQAGGENVHAEQFTIAQGWAEGDTHFQVIGPIQFPVRAVSFGWSPAIPAPIKARVLYVGEGKPEDFAKAGDISGAIVVASTDVLNKLDDLFAEYMKAPAIVDQAVKGKAAAVAFLASREHDILYRHIHAQAGSVDVLPMVVIAREDGERIARLQEAGQKLQAQLVMPNKIGGAIKSANLVAEIRGTEKPDEFVVLGAHLDSWELGTGALDNGCNAALVIDALRTINASGLKPKRSIRFILFSGEEEGMLGSKAYVTQHRNDMDHAVAALIIDEGTGAIEGFSLGGRGDAEPVVKQVIAPLAQWKANALTTDAFWGTDNLDFLLEGVPTLVANQDAANYLVNYHATSDTFDKVDMPQLKKHVAMMSYMTYAIADAPERIAKRQTRAEVEQLMKQTGLEHQLKLFGGWEEWQKGTRGRTQ
jgi:Zn-dependent M28 family amino/carboxypeptidase